MEDELDGKITKESAGLRTNIYGYLADNNDEYKKGIKKVCHKQKKNLNLKIMKII